MSAPLQEYDPAQVVATWSGIPLTNGIVEGTFLLVKRNTPLTKLHKGGDGEGARVFTKDHSGTLQVTLRNGSKTSLALAAITNTDMLTGAIVAPLLILDFSGRTLHAMNRTWVQTFPEDSFSANTEESRVWVFECDHMFNFPGGSRDVNDTESPVGFAGLGAA